MATEVELKFIAEQHFAPDVVLQRLADHGDIEPLPQERQRDMYVDTGEDELLRAGLAARVRENDDGVVIQPKSVPLKAQSVAVRSEIELRAASVEQALAEIERYLAEEYQHRLGAPLQQRVVLRKTRERWCLRREGHSAELAFDRVEVEGEDGVAGTFAELELELLAGDPKWIERLGGVLRDVEGLRASDKSKFERARAMMGLRKVRPRPVTHDFTASTPAAVAAKRIVVGQLETIEAFEAGTRLGLDPHYLHKMRVATRRLRTALRVLAGVLPSEHGTPTGSAGAWDELAGEVRWLGRRLGAVRDLDVFLADLPRRRAVLGHKPARGWRAFERLLQERHVRARRKLVDALASERYRQLRGRMHALLTTGLEPTEERSDTIAALSGTLIAKHAEALSAAIAAFPAEPSFANAHRIRIAAKRLRYTLEFLRPLGDTHAALIDDLATFQDRLGELQDLAELGRLARKLRSVATHDRTAFVLGLLAGAGGGALHFVGDLVMNAIDELGRERTGLLCR